MAEQDHWHAELTRRQFLGGVVVGAAALGLPGLTSDAFAAVTPKHGGNLRVGFVGGGTAETLDPHKSVAFIDAARAKNLFDKLTEFRPDMSVEYQLATSMEPNKDATQWQIKLRPGVVWHDGKPLTADDVIYSLARNLNPKNGLQAMIDLAPVDLKRTKKTGKLEILLALHQPIAEIPQLFAARTLSIVQAGATNFAHPIGTGPFKYVSFTPGTKSVFARNEHYWMHGKPYVDQLVMNSIPDNGARYNALVSGQIDAMENLDLATAKTLVPGGFNIHGDGVAVSTNKAVKLVNAPGSNMVAMCMLTNRPPFTDVRVRQAFRLAIDRPATLESAFVGFGQLGNDVYGKGLPDYDTSLPQRTADPAQAKALLKQAGHSKSERVDRVIEGGARHARVGDGVCESGEGGRDQSVGRAEPGRQLLLGQVPEGAVVPDAVGDADARVTARREPAQGCRVQRDGVVAACIRQGVRCCAGHLEQGAAPHALLRLAEGGVGPGRLHHLGVQQLG